MAVPKRTALTWPARAAVEAAQEPAQSDRMSCTPCTSCHWRLMNTCTISRAVLLPAAPHALSHTSVHNIGCKLHLSCRLLLPQAALPSILRCWHTAVLQSRATRRRGNTSSRTRTDGRTGASTGERRSRPDGPSAPAPAAGRLRWLHAWGRGAAGDGRVGACGGHRGIARSAWH